MVCCNDKVTLGKMDLLDRLVQGDQVWYAYPGNLDMVHVVCSSCSSVDLSMK